MIVTPVSIASSPKLPREFENSTGRNQYFCLVKLEKIDLPWAKPRSSLPNTCQWWALDSYWQVLLSYLERGTRMRVKGVLTQWNSPQKWCGALKIRCRHSQTTSQTSRLPLRRSPLLRVCLSPSSCLSLGGILLENPPDQKGEYSSYLLYSVGRPCHWGCILVPFLTLRRIPQFQAKAVCGSLYPADSAALFLIPKKGPRKGSAR